MLIATKSVSIDNFSERYGYYPFDVPYYIEVYRDEKSARVVFNYISVGGQKAINVDARFKLEYCKNSFRIKSIFFLTAGLNKINLNAWLSEELNQATNKLESIAKMRNKHPAKINYEFIRDFLKADPIIAEAVFKAT